LSEGGPVYKKQNSFMEIHHSKTVSDVLPRLKQLSKDLNTLKITSYQKDILRLALSEIFDPSQMQNDSSPFHLHSFNIAEIEQLTDDELPRFLFYRYRYETFPQRLKIDSFPPCLQIEPTSICNYRCLFCYQVDEEFTQKANGMMGMMSLDLFKKIIDETEGQCEAVTLASRGEPLICPDIEAMLRYMSGKFLALKLNTNAWFLDEKLSHAILESGINTVVFSADAASEPAYSKLRVNGSLERVHENIKRFQSIRERDYPESRTITRVSGVKVPGTDELENMKEFWGELVDQVAFVTYNPWENSYDKSTNGISEPCSDLWRRMFVWWDGKVNPCDVDFKSHLCVGNASSEDLESLWQSEKYTALRENHIAAKRSQCEPCNRCTLV
jgi:radical SAM protein with 4Fe4S-binding SPASM domain